MIRLGCTTFAAMIGENPQRSGDVTYKRQTGSHVAARFGALKQSLVLVDS